MHDFQRICKNIFQDFNIHRKKNYSKMQKMWLVCKVRDFSNKNSVHNIKLRQIRYLLSEKKYLIWRLLLLMKWKSKTKWFNLFLRKWRNSIHLDKIGNFFYQKLQILRQILKNFQCRGALPPSPRSLRFTHFTPFSEMS